MIPSSPSQGQRLLYLASDQYTWFTIAPKTFIVPADPADITHYANVVHITHGWSGPIAPLCPRFESDRYYQRRLLTPVMDASNVCIPCVTALERAQPDAVARGGAAFLANGRLIQRGDPTTAQVAEIRAAYHTLVERVAALERQHLADLAQLFGSMGLPFELAPPTGTMPALPSGDATDPHNWLTFMDDDPGFETWRDAHRDDGYIANGNSAHFVFHRARCTTIQGTWNEGTTWTHGEHLKLCGTDRDWLFDFVTRLSRKSHIEVCKICHSFDEE